MEEVETVKMFLCNWNRVRVDSCGGFFAVSLGAGRRWLRFASVGPAWEIEPKIVEVRW